MQIYHIHAYFGIFRSYSGIFRELCKPGISRTLAYSEFWYIQNPFILGTRGIFRILGFSEYWYIENQRHIQNPGISKTLGWRTQINSEPWHYARAFYKNIHK